MQLGLLCDSGEQSAITSCSALNNVLDKVGKASVECNDGAEAPYVGAPFVDNYGDDEGYFVESGAESVCDAPSRVSRSPFFRSPLCYCKAVEDGENVPAMDRDKCAAEFGFDPEANQVTPTPIELVLGEVGSNCHQTCALQGMLNDYMMMCVYN